MSTLEVASKDIQNLTDFQLTNLLSILLYNEANKYGIAKHSVSVALNITVADDGEDGHIRWEGNVECTDWLPSRYSLFQVKATEMSITKCKHEVLSANGKLKPRVDDVINEKGSYILFTNKELNEKSILIRIKAFEEAIKSVKNDADPEIEIYDSSKIAEWCNQYIAARNAVWKWNGKPLLMSANTWDNWCAHSEFQNPYITNYELEQNILELREYLRDDRKVARIIGLPGKGKTRLALEVFRSDSDPNVEALNKRVIYVDASYSKADILSTIISWRNLGVSGIIVVDNCDYEFHKDLKSVVEHTESKFTLLTIDYNLHRSDSPDPLIIMDNISQDIIEGIIKNSYPEMYEEDLDRIVNFADGFPSIATLLAEARINNFETIGSIQDEELVNKLLWGRDAIDAIALKVIEACAIFEHIGFTDEKEYEMKYVAEIICGISVDEFYEKCNYFMKKKIIVQQGRYIKLVPKTLAITVASKWWEKCRPQKAQEILLDDNLPKSMIEQLCNQISKLHFLEKAKELTLTLCGVQAPFGQAEILSSENGSRIFCSFVEIDPIVTAKTLEREFSTMSISELKEVKDGRRNLVRALEKLCFWDETFESSAKILARFAAAENEHWANNATGQFNQLFHYILSGTQADYQNRVNIIKWALYSDEREVKKIGINSANHALQSQGFSRMLGVESQGSRPSMQEWRPSNRGEVFEYWDQIMNLLTELIVKEDDCSNLILEAIVDNIFSLIRSDYVENLDENLEKIFSKLEYYWPEFNEKIDMLLKFDESKMPKDKVHLIRSWLVKLKPKDMKTKFLVLVSNANDDYREDNNNDRERKYYNASHTRIDKLIDDIYPSKLDEVIKNLEVLLLGRQLQTTYFGERMFNKMGTEEKKLILDLTFKKMKEILVTENKKDLNTNILGGFLSSLKVNGIELLKEFLINLDNAEYAWIYIDMIRYIDINKNTFNILLKHVQESNIEMDSLLTLAYGSALNNIDEDDLLAFLDSIYNLNVGFDQIVTWKIFYRLYLNSEKLSSKATRFLVRLLENSVAISINSQITYELIEILNKLYNSSSLDRETFSQNMLQLYLDIIAEGIEYKQETIIGKYIQLITINEPVVSWEILSKNILEAEGLYQYRLKNVVSTNFFNEDEVAIRNVPIAILKSWATSEEKAPEILAEIYPVKFVIDEEQDLIHYLIINHGNETVLRNIDRQLRTFSWIGSLIPHYESLKKFYERYVTANTSLRNWALKNIHYLESDIDKERIREEEERLRF